MAVRLQFSNNLMKHKLNSYTVTDQVLGTEALPRFLKHLVGTFANNEQEASLVIQQQFLSAKLYKLPSSTGNELISYQLAVAV